MPTTPTAAAGAWVDATSGCYAWLDGAARWLDLAAATGAFKLPPETVQVLGKTPWDLSSCTHQEALAGAMADGLIRVRLRENIATFEVAIPVEAAILGAYTFMAENLEGRVTCRFNCIGHSPCKEFKWEEGQVPLSKGDTSFLIPAWQRQPTRPPVPAPWLLLETGDEDHRLSVCALDPRLGILALLETIRPHVGPAGGWLGLPDKRRWRLKQGQPPLVRVDQGGMFHGFEVCPDCGWPRQGEVTPCKCWTRSMCKVCSMPSFWPIPMHETITLDGKMLYVPHTAGFAHRCIDWARVAVTPFIQP